MFELLNSENINCVFYDTVCESCNYRAVSNVIFDYRSSDNFIDSSPYMSHHYSLPMSGLQFIS